MWTIFCFYFFLFLTQRRVMVLLFLLFVFEDLTQETYVVAVHVIIANTEIFLFFFFFTWTNYREKCPKIPGRPTLLYWFFLNFLFYSLKKIQIGNSNLCKKKLLKWYNNSFEVNPINFHFRIYAFITNFLTSFDDFNENSKFCENGQDFLQEKYLFYFIWRKH